MIDRFYKLMDLKNISIVCSINTIVARFFSHFLAGCRVSCFCSVVGIERFWLRPELVWLPHNSNSWLILYNVSMSNVKGALVDGR